MVSYKRLTPEDVHFSGVPLLQSADDLQDSELKVEDSERPLLARKPRCSITAALLILGGFILVVLGIWLLGNVLWLRSTASIGLHRPPAPAAQPNNGLVQENRTQPESCAGIPESWRFDCYPERVVVVTEDMCHARNCCFTRAAKEKPGIPWCYYPPEFPSYTLVAINDTETGLSGKLLRTQKTYYPKDVEVLKLDVLYETNSRLRVKITDPAQQRFQVPIDVPVVEKSAPSPLYTVEFSKQPFGIIVKRKQNGAVLPLVNRSTLSLTLNAFKSPFSRSLLPGLLWVWNGATL
ncbi:lysosomal alpha-glucosidase [Tachysurus ichikawai]